MTRFNPKILFLALLCGGDKKTQRRDITTAKNLWAEYLKRKGA